MTMTPETLVCAENISLERLSALRDEGLSPAEERKLRAHIATCPACTARLIDFDRVASALRAQSELEPGDRILNDVHAALAAPHSARSHVRLPRRLWTRVATLAPVAAIILLFVYVFSGLAGRFHPTPTTTPTALAPTSTPSLIPGKTVVPTETPAVVSLPTFTAAVSTSAAWGTLAAAASYQTPNVANTQFALDTLTPDGSILFGTEMTNASPGNGLQTVYLISYDLASHTHKRLGPQWSGYSGPWGGVDGASAQYVGYGYNSQPGATCGVCNNTLWAFNRQNGSTWKLDPGRSYSGVLTSFSNGDHTVFSSVDEQIWMADYATQRVKLILPIDAQPVTNATTTMPTLPADRVILVGFTWPYVVYIDDLTPAAGAADVMTLRVFDIQTNTVYIMPTPLDANPGLLPDMRNSAGTQTSLDDAVMVDGHLYVTTGSLVNGVDSHGAQIQATYETLYEITDIASPNGQIKLLARWQTSETNNQWRGIMGANSRLIALRGGMVWDSAENRLVQVSPVNSGDTPSVSVAGNFLMITHVVSGANTPTPIDQGAIYAISGLPIR